MQDINDRADRLACKATIRNGMRLEDLNWHNLRAQCQGHHTINRLEERRRKRQKSKIYLETGSLWIKNNNIGTVSKATLGKLLRDEVERIWAFPKRLELNWTGRSEDSLMQTQNTPVGLNTGLRQGIHWSQLEWALIPTGTSSYPN